MTSLAGGVKALVGPGLYDAVIRMPLFKDAYDQDRGWPLGVYEDNLKMLDMGVGVRVVPIGHFNAGKTWLIRKLIESSDTALAELKEQTGDDVHTEGFSIKMAQLAGQKQRCVFLDTAGLNSPVTSIGALGAMLKDKDGKPVQPTGPAKMKAMEEMLEELKRHESFIRRVSFDFAQVFLVVVGQVSHRDQIDLINLIEQASRCPTAKQVIVVHNLKRMSLQDFRDTPDNQTGDTYLRSMEKVFKMSSMRMCVSNPGSEVDELFGAFGISEFGNADKPRVSIRHLFLTDDDKPCGKEQNAHVLQRIRNLINNIAPSAGSVLTELGQIMTRCAASMVRLPPGKTVELRAHRKAGLILAGVVTAAEQQEIAEKKADPEAATKLDELFTAAAAAKEAVAAARDRGESLEEPREAFRKAEDELSEAMALMASGVFSRVLDAEQLELLDPAKDAVACKPIPLGGMARHNNSAEKYVRHNVTRVRGWVEDSPHWLTSVHMTLPGLAPGELAKIREQLRWDAGASEFKESPSADAVLQLTFDAAVLAVPDRQKLTLSTPAGGTGTGRVMLTEDPIEVIDSGTRPFPTRASLGRGSEGDSAESEQAVQTLHVVVQTGVENAISDVQPVVTYARGILSVTVACSLSAEDERVEPPAWVESEEAEHVQLDNPADGTNGSDDDVQGTKPRPQA